MILGIDSASSSSSVAIGQATRILYAAQLRSGRTHSEQLLPMLAAALEGLGIRPKELEAVAVTAGPGSFTGLRIGMSTAKGFAQGAGIDFVALPTLDVLAQNGRSFEGLVCPILNARRNEVYTALFYSRQGSLSRRACDQALSIETLIDALVGKGPVFFCGDGLEAYAEQLAKGLGDDARMATGTQSAIQASALVSLASEKLATDGPDDLMTTGPTYLRQSEAVLRWQEANPGKSLED